MSKFKIGDRVMCVLGWPEGVQDGVEYEVSDISEITGNIAVKGLSGYWNGTRFKLCLPKGPVRTKTVTTEVKEIVPGTYGIVTVYRIGTGELRWELLKSNANATELRAAAQVLNQLADALEQ